MKNPLIWLRCANQTFTFVASGCAGVLPLTTALTLPPELFLYINGPLYTRPSPLPSSALSFVPSERSV